MRNTFVDLVFRARVCLSDIYSFLYVSNFSLNFQIAQFSFRGLG
jgi:hypothetical protein